MRRFHLGVLTAALPLLSLGLLALAGCKGETPTTNNPTPDNKEQGPSTSSEMKAVPAKGGVIKGVVKLKGNPPGDLAEMTKKLQDEMASKPDKDACLMSPDWQKQQQVWWIGDNKQVGNVFVWIKPEKGQFFEISEDQLKEARDNPPKLGQPHCVFVPHCLVAFPAYRNAKTKKIDKTGQKFVVLNNASIGHNTNITGGGNDLLKPNTEKDFNIKPASVPIPISCNIHPWMRAYAGAFDHPYAAVTLAEGHGKDVKKDDPKYGSYEIKNTPVGKVRIIAWHEKGEFLNKNGGDGEEIEIKEGQPLEKNFEIEAK